MKIIINRSPQLGDDERDLNNYVDTLKIDNGKSLIDFYNRAQTIQQEITLQQDESGQEKRLVRKFLNELKNNYTIQKKRNLEAQIDGASNSHILDRIYILIVLQQ